MKRVLCLLLCLMLVPLSAFGGKRRGLSYCGHDLHPHHGDSSPHAAGTRYRVPVCVVYESLVTVDDNGLPQPLLAES